MWKAIKKIQEKYAEANNKEQESMITQEAIDDTCWKLKQINQELSVLQKSTKKVRASACDQDIEQLQRIKSWLS